ncbi:MAG: YlmC/YmxH family sporulation protein [Candidatus Ventricola sp.]|nr:YlmC/YmxH family sporulation protein [Candidatus Ventricola sp.]
MEHIEVADMMKKGARAMTYSELRKKDIICIGDGRLLGRASDLELDAKSGRILALIVACPGGLASFLHGDKNQLSISWQQIACIGDDVILVSTGCCP